MLIVISFADMFNQKTNSDLIEEKRQAAFSSSTCTNQHCDASNLSKSITLEASKCEASELLNDGMGSNHGSMKQ